MRNQKNQTKKRRESLLQKNLQKEQKEQFQMVSHCSHGFSPKTNQRLFVENASNGGKGGFAHVETLKKLILLNLLSSNFSVEKERGKEEGRERERERNALRRFVFYTICTHPPNKPMGCSSKRWARIIDDRSGSNGTTGSIDQIER